MLELKSYSTTPSLLIFYVCVNVSMYYLGILFVCIVSMKPEEGIGSPVTGVTGSYEPS